MTKAEKKEAARHARTAEEIAELVKSLHAGVEKLASTIHMRVFGAGSDSDEAERALDYASDRIQRAENELIEALAFLKELTGEDA